MAKIQFSNGKIANFGKSPSQADIDFAAQKIGVSSQGAIPIADTVPMTPSATQPTGTPSGGGILDKLGSFVKGEFTGVPQKTNIVGDIVQGTVGSKGIIGAGQMLGRAFTQPGLLSDIQTTSKSLSDLANMTNQMLKMQRQSKDSMTKSRLGDAIRGNAQQMNDMRSQLADLQSRVLEPKEAAATLGRAAIALTPYAEMGGIGLTAEEAPTVMKAVEQALGVIQKGGGLAGAGGRIAAGGLESGLLSGGYGALTAFGQNKSATDISKTALSYGLSGAVIGAAIQGGAETINGIANAMKSYGNRIQLNKISPSSKDIADGFKAENVEKYGLYGSNKQVVNDSESMMSDLNHQYKETLSGKEEKISVPSIFDDAQKAMEADKAVPLGKSGSVARVFEDIKKDTTHFWGNKAVDLSDATSMKRVFGGSGAWEYGKGFDPDASVRELVFDYLYDSVKTKIEAAVPSGDVGVINQAISELIPIRNAALRHIPAEMRAAPIGLKDFIGATAALIDPKAAALLGVNIISRSGQAAGALVGAGNALGQMAGGITGAPATLSSSAVLGQMAGRLGEQQ